MATTAIAVLQQVWDCRWSRHGYRVTGVPAALQPETQWVCIREGSRRDIENQECRTCPHWEPEPTPPADAHPSAAIAPALSSTAAVAATRQLPLVAWSFRGVMLLNAAIFVGTGLAILSSPAAVPVTVALWISGAATAALGLLTRLPE